MIYVLLFILGSVLGSFYLVAGMRGGKELSIVTPRSHCDSCGETLKWYHLIPIFSYIFLGGKCHKCHAKIPVSNIMVEFFTGVFFALSYMVYGYSLDTLISLIIISVLVITYITDFNYLIILNTPIILGTLGVIIIKYFQDGLVEASLSLLYGIILFLVMLFIKFSGDKIFKKESLGGGDIKLAIFIGSLLGLKFGLIALVISCFIALPYAMYVSLREKEKEIPFGPFLITAAFLVFLYSEQISKFLDLLLYF